MNKSDEFKLVDGCYEPAEATEILANLINFKIRFHNNRLFSKNERGVACEESEKRIEELRTAREKIKDMLKNCEYGGHEVTIKANLQVQVSETETVEISI